MQKGETSNTVFKTIWLHPRKVFSTLKTGSYNKYTYVLPILVVFIPLAFMVWLLIAPSL